MKTKKSLMAIFWFLLAVWLALITILANTVEVVALEATLPGLNPRVQAIRWDDKPHRTFYQEVFFTTRDSSPDWKNKVRLIGARVSQADGITVFAFGRCLINCVFVTVENDCNEVVIFQREITSNGTTSIHLERKEKVNTYPSATGE